MVKVSNQQNLWQGGGQGHHHDHRHWLIENLEKKIALLPKETRENKFSRPQITRPFQLSDSIQDPGPIRCSSAGEKTATVGTKRDYLDTQIIKNLV